MAALGGAACSPHTEADRMVDRGWKSFDHGDKQEALTLFRDVMRREPDGMRAHHAYEDAMIDMGRYDELKNEYAADLASHKESGLAYFFMAYIDDDFPEAQRLVREGLLADPKNSSLQWLDQIYVIRQLINHGQ